MILKLFQVKHIRLLDMGAGVLSKSEFEANHHLYLTLQSRDYWGKKGSVTIVNGEFLFRLSLDSCQLKMAIVTRTIHKTRPNKN